MPGSQPICIAAAKRRKTAGKAVILAACAALFGLFNAPLLAAYPDQPVKFIVSFAAGGPTDLVARIAATAMSKSLGQSVIVENRAGGGARIGAAAVAAAKADGYTVLSAGPSSLIALAALPPALPFDVQKQFVPVGVYALAPNILVGSPNLPVANFKEAIELFRANPGKYAYGSSGTGTAGHYAPFIIFRMLGVELIHVPYKGTGPALADVQAGRVALSFDTAANSSARVKSGQLKGLVILEKNRVPQLPNVPSAAELYPEILKYNWTSWFGIVTPAGTPNDAVETLHKSMIAASKDAELLKRYDDLGMDPSNMALPEVRQFISRQYETLVPMLKSMDLKLD